MKIIVLIGVALAACDPGPLPDLPRRAEQGQQVDYKQYWFPTDSAGPLPLDLAIQSGNFDEVRRLLERGEDPNLRWGESGDRFPLQEVLEAPSWKYPISNPVEMINLLLKHGADPNARWCPDDTRGPSEWHSSCTAANGMTPLNFATTIGQREVVEVLIDAGAIPDARDFGRRSALDYAADEVIFERISRAMFPDLATRDKKTLEVLERSNRPGPLVRALNGADDIVPPPRSFGDYGIGSEERMVGRMRSLLRIGADPNERPRGDRPALSFALYNRTLRVVRVILQNGADVNLRWCELFTAPWASVANSPRHLIVTEGEPHRDPSCTLDNGITALMWSAASGDGNAVRLLLEFKANRSLRDWAGRTALDYAQESAVRDLLSERP